MATPQSMVINEYTKVFKDKKLSQSDLTKLLISVEETPEPCEKCRRIIQLWNLFGSIQRIFENPMDVFPRLYHATSMFAISPGFAQKVDMCLKQQLGRALSLCTKLYPFTSPQLQPLTVTIFDPWANTQPSEFNDVVAQQLFDTESPELLATRVEALHKLGLRDQAWVLCMRCLEHYLQESYLFPAGERDSETQQRIRPHVLFLGWKLVFESQEDNREGLTAYLCSQTKELRCHESNYLLSMILEKWPGSRRLASTPLPHILILQELHRANPSLCCTREMMQQWIEIVLKLDWTRLEVEESLRNMMTNYATVSSHFYLLVDILVTKFGDHMLHLYIELYVRALTSDRNYLEALKEREAMVEFSRYIAEALTRLAMLLPKQHAKVAQQCAVAAFSLHPTEGRLHLIHYLTRSPPPPALPPPADCNCGGRCLTPTREDPLPEYAHPCPPHHLLDAVIRGVPFQLLVDLTGLLEGMTSHLLSAVGTWREIGPAFNEYLRNWGAQQPTAAAAEATSDSESDSEVAKRLTKNDPRINVQLLAIRRKNIKLQIANRRKEDVPLMIKKQQQPSKKKAPQESNNNNSKQVGESSSMGGESSSLEDSKSSAVEPGPSTSQQQPWSMARPAESSSKIDTSIVKIEPRPSIITTVSTTKNSSSSAESIAPKSRPPSTTPDGIGHPPPLKIPKMETTWIDSRNSASPGQRDDNPNRVVNQELKRKEENQILKRIFGTDFDASGNRIQQPQQQARKQLPNKVPLPQQQLPPTQPTQQQPLQGPDHNLGVRDKPYKYVVPIPTIKKLLYQANHTNKLTLGFVVKDSNKVKKVEFPVSEELARQLASRHSGNIIIEPNMVDKGHRIVFSSSNRSSSSSSAVAQKPVATSSVSSTSSALNLTPYKMAAAALSSPTPPPEHQQYLLKNISAVDSSSSQPALATDNSRPLPPYSQIKLKNSSFFSSPSSTPPTNHQSPVVLAPPSSQSTPVSSYSPVASQGYDPLYPAADSQGVDLSLSFRENSFFDSPQQQQNDPSSLNQLVGGYDGMNFGTPQSSQTSEPPLYHQHQPATPDSSSSSQPYQSYSSSPYSYANPQSSPGGYSLEQQTPPKSYYPSKPAAAAYTPQPSYEEPEPSKKGGYLHSTPPAPAEPQYYPSPSTFRPPDPPSQVEPQEDPSPTPKRRRDSQATCGLCGSTLCSYSSLKRHLRSVHKNQLSPETLERLNQNFLTPDGLAAKLASNVESKRNYEATPPPQQPKPRSSPVLTPHRPSSELRNPELAPQASSSFTSNFPAPSDFLPYVEKPVENKVALQVFGSSSSKPLQCYLDKRQASQMEDLLGQLEKLESEAAEFSSQQQPHFNPTIPSSSASSSLDCSKYGINSLDYNNSFDSPGNSLLAATDNSYMSLKDKTVAYKLALQRKIMSRNKNDPPSQQPSSSHPMSSYQTKLS